MSKVSLDLGGSAIRIMYENKLGKKTLTKMLSNCIKIAITERIVKDLKDRLDDFQIVEAPLREAKGRYARGEASRYFDGVQSVVDNQELKVNQVATYVNAIHALAKYVLGVHGTTPVELKRVGIVIPIKEFYSEFAEVPKDKLAGTHTVYFPVVNKTVVFTVRRNSLKIGPEGGVVVFAMRRLPKYKDIIENGNGIVLDPGKRSTDIGIFKKFIAEGKSVRSFPHGGITMEATLSAELEKMNIPTSGEDLREVMETGVSSGVAVGTQVHKAKEVFGGTLRQDVTIVLAHSEMSARNIDWILPVGRPFKEQPEAEWGKPTYTGSLLEEVKKGMREDVVIIDCGDLETANVSALYDMLA